MTTAPSRIAALCREHPVVICPLITPLDERQQLDVSALHGLLDRLAGEVDGLMLLGTTGELALLPDDVADQLVDEVVAALPDVPLIIGAGGASLAETRRRIGRATERIDSIAICAPYYYDYTPAELRHHLIELADQAPRPLILYNIPQHTRNPLTGRLVRELARHENIIGIKDSSPDRAEFTAILESAADDFFVLRGTDEVNVCAYLDQGADGFVAGLENLSPGLTRRIFTARTDRDEATLTACLQTLTELLQLVRGHGGIRAIKAAAGVQLGRPLYPALPALPPSADELRIIADGVHWSARPEPRRDARW